MFGQRLPFELGFVKNFFVQFYDVNEVALFWHKLIFNNCGSLIPVSGVELILSNHLPAPAHLAHTQALPLAESGT